MRKKTTLKAKVKITIAIAVFAMLVIWGRAQYTFNQVDNNWNQFISSVTAKQLALVKLQASIGYGGLIHQVKNGVLRGQEKYHARAVEKGELALRHVAEYQSIKPISPVEEKALNTMKEMINAYVAAANTTSQLISEGKSSAEIDGSIKINDGLYQGTLEALLKELERNTMAQTEAMSGNISSGKNFLTIFSLGFIALFSIGALLLAQKTIFKPINNIIEALNLSIGDVSEASGKIATDSQSLAEGSTEQAASLEESAAALDQLAGQANKNAANAGAAKALVTDSHQKADQGSATVGKMVVAVSEINKSSEKIGEIIKVIEEISFQTNLLALNAAVEAARAGEQGKGFAVVAEEVRNLAQRSASAAKDIVALVEDARSKSKEGNALAVSAGEALDEIVTSVQDVVSMVDEIAMSSNEQAQGIEHLNIAVGQLDIVTQRNASSAEESNGSAGELSFLSLQLNEVVKDISQFIGTNGHVNGNGNGNGHMKALPGAGCGMSVYWDPSVYSVGVTEMDDQHQRLFEILDNLCEGMTSGEGRESIGWALEELINYATMHLKEEERLMQRHGYPDFESHKAIHDRIMGEVSSLYEDYKNGDVSVVLKIVKFVKDWLVTHIKTVDKKYGEYIAHETRAGAAARPSARKTLAGVR